MPGSGNFAAPAILGCFGTVCVWDEDNCPCLFSYFCSHVEHFSLPALAEYALGFQGTSKCVQLKIFMDAQECCVCVFRRTHLLRVMLYSSQGRGPHQGAVSSFLPRMGELSVHWVVFCRVFLIQALLGNRKYGPWLKDN